MRFLDLCAGIGGFSLGLEMAGMKCAGQVEIDDYCNRILEKHWPHVPRWGDIKIVNPAALPAVELICGGYPCQPFSCAGKRRGEEDDRHLWPYIEPIVAELRPAWCLFENVNGHVTLGLDAVLSDLAALGYTCWPLVIPACAVDAPHRRDRIWLVAHAESGAIRPGLCEGEPAGERRGRLGDGGGQSGNAPNTSGQGLAVWPGTPKERSHAPTPGGHRWPVEPGVGRVAHGVPRRVDRIRALGNAVVPQLVAEIGRSIMVAHERT